MILNITILELSFAQTFNSHVLRSYFSTLCMNPKNICDVLSLNGNNETLVFQSPSKPYVNLFAVNVAGAKLTPCQFLRVTPYKWFLHNEVGFSNHNYTCG